MPLVTNVRGYPYPLQQINQGIESWTASRNYPDGETVITPGGATVSRSGTGTSGATYDATEAANYVLRDVGPVQTVYPGAGVYLYAGQTIAIEDRFYRWPADGPTANAAFTETDWVFASGDRAARFDSVAGLRGATLPTGVQTIDIAGYYGVGTPGGGTGMIVDRTDSVTLDDGAFFFRTANNVLVRRVDQTRISLAQAGAVPSVLTDQSAFMNAALTGLSSGGTLVIDPGRRYYIDAAGYEITRNNVTIDGEGTGELFNDQVGTATGLLRISGNNVTIKGVRFVNDFTTLGTLINLYAIELTGGDSVIMDGNYFKNWRYCCLGRAGSSWAVFSRNEVDTEPNGLTGCVLNGSNTVQKENRIIAFGDTGLGVASDTARNVTISNNLVVSRATHSSLGIIIEEGVEGALVSGNVVDGMWDGVTASNLGVSNGIRISDNATGRAPKGVVLVNNVVRNCEVYGIHVLNSAGGGATQLVENLVLQGNVVTACGSAPYQVSDVDKGVVNGNIASESNDFGIITQDNTDLVFIGNIAHGNTGTGMRPDNAVGHSLGILQQAMDKILTLLALQQLVSISQTMAMRETSTGES